jgi:membrane fusion protein, multidrug efflux system
MRAKTVLCCVMAASAALVVGCKRAPSAPPPGPAEVAIVTVRPERVVLTTELPGRTVPHLVAEIRPQVNGILRERRFEEGADVRSGDLLYQIDPAPYRAAVQQAEAALAMAEANLPAARLRAERLDGLVAIRAVGKQEGDDATAALHQAEAAVAASRATLESARINLAYTPIRAPISGRIGKSSVTVGALVTAYQPVPLAVIQQLDPIYVDVPQSSADLLRLRRALRSGTLTQDGGQSRKVRLVLEDGTPYSIEGTLQFRDVTVDPATGSVSLRMVFPNPDQVLLPGMFARAIVEEGVRENAVMVPQQAVTRDPKGNATAFVVGADDKVAERKLALDRAIGDRWLVVDGLAAGDRVIVEGMQRVRPGASVRAVPFADAAK